MNPAVVGPTDMLRRVPLFEELDADELRLVAASIHERTFRAGDTVQDLMPDLTRAPAAPRQSAEAAPPPSNGGWREGCRAEQSRPPMAVALEEVFPAADVLSPEVVLVSSPEVARLARARPSPGRWEEAVRSARIDQSAQAQPSFVLRNAGMWGFYLFCLAMTGGPMALVVLLGRS